MKIITTNVSDLKEIPEFRNFYESQSNEELTESIKVDKQQYPIQVTEDLEIIDGYRRVDAIKAAGGTTVLAIIKPCTPEIYTRIVLNKYREKTACDKVREIKEAFKKYPKRQGKRSTGDQPYKRPELISSALNGRWKNDVIQNRLEYILNHDLEGDILSKGIVENNWKVDTCYEFLKNMMEVDTKKGYGFTKDLMSGKYNVAEVNKFIAQRLALDNKHRHTFVIPKKANSYKMDCVKLVKLPEYLKKVDLTVTSIPYWDLRDYKEGAERQLGQEETKEEYAQNIANIFNKILPVYKDTANVIVNIAETYRDGVGQGIPFLVQEYIERETSLIYKDTLIWSKKNPRPQGESVQRPLNSVEYLIWFVVNPSKAKYNLLTFPVDGKSPKITGGVRDMASNGNQPKKRKSVSKNYGKIKSHLKEQEVENIVISSVGKNHDIFKISEVGHPAPMSPMLPVTPILMLSDEGDMVCDPFGGSNVVGKVALELNRRYVSTEISKEYFDIGCEMLNKGAENYDREELDSINSLIYSDKNDSTQLAA